MENSLKALLLAAAVAITLTVITMGFFILKQAQGITKSASEKVNQVGIEIEEAEFTMYDHTKVSGTEVVNVVRKYQDERIGIQVETKKNASSADEWFGYTITSSDGTYEIGSSSSSDIDELIDSSNNNYVNPNGQFLGEIIRNENNNIIGLIFEQQ